MKDSSPPNFRDLREQAGLSLAELGRRTRISTRMLSYYESGEALPRLDNALRIAEALGCEASDLVGDAA